MKGVLNGNRESEQDPTQSTEAIALEPEPINALGQAERILVMCENYQKRNNLNKQISRLGKMQKRKFKKMVNYVEEVQDLKYSI
jgi:hypothetical protein